MQAKDIANLLADSSESVALELLPNGKRTGKEWKCGSVCGEEGESLSLCLRGAKAGTWKDFATGDGGDLLDLWAQAKGVSISEAMDDACRWLGVERMPFANRKRYEKPQKPQCRTPASRVLEWLTQTRKLTPEAVIAYKIAEDGESVVFPSLRGGELLRWKSRNIHDKHKCQTSSNSEPCLFGWQAIPSDDRAVVICEGEIDAVSWWQMGYPALSVPNGAQGHSWIEAEYDNLERFDVIYVAMDSDDAGKKAAAEIIDRLGRERCRLVKMPEGFKDANDLVRAQCQQAAALAIERAQTVDPKELKPASYYHAKALDIFTGKNIEDVGYLTPWPKVQDRFRFRPGELTILAGENFHGKSEACNHFTLEMKAQGAKCCVASLEFVPEKWIANMARQAAAIDGKEASTEYSSAVMEFVESNLWVFDVSSGAKTEMILGIFEYSRRRYAVDVFVIDNLQKCGIADDDYNAQKLFTERLSDFAKIHGVHVLLVHHLNKANDEGPRNKSAVKGSGGITDMAHNVIIWWRNREKERRIEAGETEEEVLGKCDAMMIVEKQRETGDTPKVMLWFHRASRQFVPFRGAQPKKYVRYQEVSNGLSL